MDQAGRCAAPRTGSSTALTRRSLGALAVGTAAATTAAALPGGSALAAPADRAQQSPWHSRPADPNAPVEQLRGVWIASVVNIDWPSSTGLSPEVQQQELIDWFDMARRLNLNAVMLQVRPTADAFWPSPYEPWSQYLTGTQGRDPGYDPLQFAVTEAHKRNLELHAWFNPYRVSMQTDPTQLVEWHPARRHPDWVFAYGPKLYYNPGIPEVRRFVQDAILDATRYDIDGIHFDDYFYPYPVSGQDLPDADTFARYGAGFDDIEDWRRHNINLLIAEISHRIHARKPWLRFGVSPFGIWRNASSDPRGSDTNGFESFSGNYADTRTWVKRNWLDYVNPQVYWNIGLAVADYAKLTPWWAEQVAGTDVQLYIGEATYKVGAAGQPDAWQDPAELSRHLTLDQQYPEVDGNVYFSAVQMRADRLGATSKLVADHYQHPAITPAMAHLDPRRPHRPVLTRVRPGPDGVTLHWHRTSNPEPASYLIYRFDGWPHIGDFVDATHLIDTVHATGHHESYTDSTAQPGRRYTYAVVAASRTSVRSAPSLPRRVR